MATLEQKQLFHGVHPEENAGCSCVHCIDGTGKVEYCQVFPGMQVFVNHFQAYRCQEYYEKGEPLQINYCFEGRFECTFSEKECCILGPGDFSVHGYEGGSKGSVISEFPLGYYRGVGIYLDDAAAGKWAKAHMGVLAPDFGQIREQFLHSRWYRVRKAPEGCAHVFEELLELVRKQDIALLRLKAAELFLLFGRMPKVSEELPYFPREQVELVKLIKDRMVSGQDSYISLEKLGLKYGISVTQLQKIFKSLYGVPVYQYLREYRMEKAAVALSQTGRSVTEIALEAGFTNPGKFAESFRRRYEMTPTQYRIKTRARMIKRE